MIFDEVKIATITDNGELYVSVNELATHLDKAVHEFTYESEELSKIIPLTKQERLFIMGLAEGMYNIVLMLRQANDEHGINTINTVDDFLEKFRNESS
jgi:hypothetical protein